MARATKEAGLTLTLITKTIAGGAVTQRAGVALEVGAGVSAVVRGSGGLRTCARWSGE